MSKSYKRVPIFTYIGYSNKISKRWCNRKFRKKTRISILKEKDCPISLNEVMTPYELYGDGKHYLPSPDIKRMRK